MRELRLAARRAINETPEQREKRLAHQKSRQRGGAKFKQLTPEQRTQRNQQLRKKRETLKPGLAKYKPRRKFQNQNPSCLTMANVDEVYELRYNARIQEQRIQELEAALTAARAEAATNRARADAAEARLESEAANTARLQKIAAGEPLSLYESFLHEQTALEPKLAEVETQNRDLRSNLKEYQDEHNRLKDWFTRTGLVQLVVKLGTLPELGDLESHFAHSTRIDQTPVWQQGLHDQPSCLPGSQGRQIRTTSQQGLHD